MLSFNKSDDNAYVYELKANFFIRKNKYTDEVKLGRRNCIKLNVENMNKNDLNEIKAKLSKINVICFQKNERNFF